MTRATIRPKPEPKAVIREIEHDAPRPQAVAKVVAPPTPFDMLSRAVEMGASLETIEKLMGLYERWQASQAKRAFDNAMADAKAKFPPIRKTKKVDFASKDDKKTNTSYTHEGLDDIAVIDPVLGAHGLSWRHRSTEDGDKVVITCVVTHRDGYAEETSLSGNLDKTGNKNDIQAKASTVTYLRRTTLKLALGLVTTEDVKDDDGRASEGGPLTAAHLAEIKRLCELTDTDEVIFADHMKAGSVADIPDSRFEVAKRKLEVKKRKQDARVVQE